MNLRCRSCKCKATLKRVAITRRRKRHVIRRHYPYEKAGEKRSLFNTAILPKFFFNKVVSELRSGMQESKREGYRFIYFYTFDFKVGTFPNAQGDVDETDTVKIVCTTVKCRKCRLLSPKEVVTIYPVERPRDQKTVARIDCEA